MRILVTNDDGINAEGLWCLVDELKRVGKVTVIAPDREQSGVGTSISFHHPLRINRIHEKIPGVPTYSVEGTPGDCVILAIKVIMTDGLDAVVSGVNQGPNCGYDVFLSGTVGAALQGFFYSIPSIAVSIDAFEEPIFATGAEIACELAEYINTNGIKGKMLLNVNVPNLPLNEIQGIDITRLGEKVYSATIEAGNDGRHDYYWIVHKGIDIRVNNGTDLWALKHRRISITPLRFNRSEYNTEFVNDMARVIAEHLFDKKVITRKEV